MSNRLVRELLVGAMVGAGLILAEQRGLLPKDMLATLRKPQEGDDMHSTLSHRRWRSRAKKRGAVIQEQSQELAMRADLLHRADLENDRLLTELVDRHPGIWKRMRRWLWGA